METESNGWGSMPPEVYMKHRVDDQISWHSKKSTINKNWHHTLQVIIIIAAALIPIISMASGDFRARIAVAIIGLITAVATGIISLYQYKDQWIDYRSTAEMLKFEKILFQTGAEPYKDENSFPLFVTRIEAILMQQNKGWKSRFINTKNNDGNLLQQIDSSNT